MTRVLVVDDEQSIRRTFDAFLRGAGYTVETAENVEAARSLLEQGCFDIVVTDILMPGVTGVELLKTLRQNAPDTQVLLMTGERR
ncbi:MAG: response regulator [Synechococcaceae cyanobacterium SM1_2_3]|nr:response regulator [Synechococcaceae cyanobacterium SM1_2_3]